MFNFNKNVKKIKLSCGYVKVKYDPKLLKIVILSINIPYIKTDIIGWNEYCKFPTLWTDPNFQKSCSIDFPDLDWYIAKWFRWFSLAKNIDELISYFETHSRSVNDLKYYLLALDKILIETTKHQLQLQSEFQDFDLSERSTQQNRFDDWEPEFKLTDEEFNKIAKQLFNI